ncbi:ABC transporter permease [Rubrobacter tropicus]|uniref:ABC transporter permease n=1 Tax=Rubrobacter tropicus TaxID=2653851 RepID=UPI001407D4AC|nr:ABC transporter permease [Rubrobacter tropicus]
MTTYTSGERKSIAGGFFDGLATFWRKRWLLRYFIQRQVTRSYKRSYLGISWILLSPLVWVFFLTLIFSDAVGIRVRIVDDHPNLNFGLYLYCGLLPFLAFSEAMNKGMNSIRSSSGLVQKVIFPLELLPFTNAMASMVDKFFGAGALVIAVVLSGMSLHWTALLLPAVIALQVLFILGLTYFMSVFGTYLPDLGEIMRPVIRGMFFLTPIIWTPDRLPESIRWVVDYNPLAYLVNAYREILLFGNPPGGLATLYFTLFSVALFVAGFAFFNRVKWGFADRL